jgi:hypothetical protein
MTRPRMLQSGVRPDKFTFKLEAEGHVVLRDARSAMAAVKSMRNMAGAAKWNVRACSMCAWLSSGQCSEHGALPTILHGLERAAAVNL